MKKQRYYKCISAEELLSLVRMVVSKKRKIVRRNIRVLRVECRVYLGKSPVVIYPLMQLVARRNTR